MCGEEDDCTRDWGKSSINFVDKIMEFNVSEVSISKQYIISIHTVPEKKY